MKADQVILVPLDFELRTSEGRRRFRSTLWYAAALARSSRLALVFLHVGASKVRWRHGVSRLQELLGVECRFLEKQGSPVDAILEAARESLAQWVVMSTHGRTGLRRMVLGSVAEGVLNQLSIPALLVGPRAAFGVKARGSSAKDARVLVGVDFKPEGADLARAICDAAKGLRATATLVHEFRNSFAVGHHDGTSPLYAAELFHLEENNVRQRKQMLEEMGARLSAGGIDCRTEIDQISSTPGEALLERAGNGYDLIVVGMKHKSLALEGGWQNTVRKLIHEAPVPVMIVSHD